MVISDFFSTEYPDKRSLQILLNRIEEVEDKKEEYFESGNVFDLTINFKQSKVYIEENLFEETTEILNLTLDEFYQEIFKMIS